MTHDLDFMVRLTDADKIHSIMESLGYKALHKTENVANYSGISELGQVDFLYAHRRYGLRMLEHAVRESLYGLPIKVVRPEDLIGLKIQSASNDANRTEQDMMDIKALLKANPDRMDMELIREYFALFKRENDLDHLLREL